MQARLYTSLSLFHSQLFFGNTQTQTELGDQGQRLKDTSDHWITLCLKSINLQPSQLGEPDHMKKNLETNCTSELIHN
jgi:hypothetical protein